MSDDLWRHHVAAMEATVVVLQAQMMALRHALGSSQSSAAVPERCVGAPSALCALQDESAKLARPSFEDPGGWQCKGCRHVGQSASEIGA